VEKKKQTVLILWGKEEASYPLSEEGEPRGRKKLLILADENSEKAIPELESPHLLGQDSTCFI